MTTEPTTEAVEPTETAVPEGYSGTVPFDQLSPAEQARHQAPTPEGGGDEPVTATAPVTPAVPATPDPSDPYAAYGGKQRVEDSLAITAALQTEQGIRQIAAETLRSIGVPADIIPYVLSGKIQVAVDDDGTVTATETQTGSEIDGLTDDDVLTVADARKLAEKIARDAVAEALGQRDQQSQVEQQQAARQAQADTATITTLQSLIGGESGVYDQGTAEAVLTYAAKYLAEDDWDPQHIAFAIQKGHADLVSFVNGEQGKYLAGKLANTQTVPANTGGGGGAAVGGAPAEEPKSLAEAFKRARQENPELFPARR